MDKGRSHSLSGTGTLLFRRPGDLLLRAILGNEDPLLFIENKLLYPLPVQNLAQSAEFSLQTWEEAPAVNNYSALSHYPPTPT